MQHIPPSKISQEEAGRLPAPTAGGRESSDRHPISEPLGGQTSISPPANVKPDPLVLASGIDTLYLALDVSWTNDSLFTYLDGLKSAAVERDSDIPGHLPPSPAGISWPFSLQPFGVKGYEWLLLGQEYTFKIGKWKEPISRPSIMVEIRSETLWHLGAKEAVEKIINLVLASGGRIVSSKPSRADLCLDLLMPESLWSLELLTHRVTRAEDMTPYFKHAVLTGFRIGSGVVSARLYDKALEITRKSKKEWMFDIWGLTEVPEGFRAIRTEFQLRREALKDLALNNTDDLLVFAPNAWAYCSRNWLKFQDRPGLHHTQRTTLPWWTVVQEGFKGAQGAHPLVRAKALRVNKKQLIQQAYGLLTSLAAIHEEESGGDETEPLDLGDCLGVVFDAVPLLNCEKESFAERVEKKRTQYHRTKDKEAAAKAKRNEFKFPIE